ncbi:MAG: hypothetical protein Q7T85_02745 [Nitrosomonas sp.]|nr:hypothetical protein [Nitrosomonas sp.]
MDGIAFIHPTAKFVGRIRGASSVMEPIHVSLTRCIALRLMAPTIA